MKKIILLFAFSVVVFSACKKADTPEPSKTITNTIRDTVKITNNVIQKDTVYCMLKSELVHGTWWAYKELGVSVTPYKVEFFSNYFVMNGSSSANNVTYTPDYSTVYVPNNIAFTVNVVNCTELSITNATGPILLRRQ